MIGVQVHLEVDRPDVLEAAVVKLRGATALRVLSISVAAVVVPRTTMALLGALPVHELHLVSAAFRRHPTLSRLSVSHLDNAGVKSYVDAICRRCVRLGFFM